MEPFVKHRGRVVVLSRANVDTDQIIPKQFLKGLARTGLGPALFYDWRYLGDGKTPNPEFELNRPAAKGASILVAGGNFGCGSSREHAAWALRTRFGLEPYRREMLLRGIDEIGRTLLDEPRIAAFERRRAEQSAGSAS